MRVLFYGSFQNDHGNLTDENLRITREIARTLVLRGHTVVTREGLEASPPGLELVDNPALTGALEGAQVSNRPDLVESICDPDHLDQNIHNKSHRKLIRAPTSERFAFYRALLKAADVVCIIGGAAGAQRLSLIARFLGKPIVPIGTTGGVAKHLWTEFSNAYLPPYIEKPDLLLSLGHLNHGGESEYVENAVTLMANTVAWTASHPDQNSSDPKLPEKISLRWLYSTVPYSFWIAAIGLMAASFTVGISATTKLTVVQQVMDVICTKAP